MIQTHMFTTQRNRPATPLTQRAFTLFELLIAIAIIAMLITVTVIVLNPGRVLDSAQKTADAHKIEQIEEALQQYAIKNFTTPTGISSTPVTICSHGFSGNCLALHNEIAHGSNPKKAFIDSIPQSDSANAPSSGYEVSIKDGFFTVTLVGHTTTERDLEPKRAYHFDGSNDFVEIGSSTSTLNFVQNSLDFTLSTWIQLDNTKQRTFFMGNSIASTNKGFAIGFENGAGLGTKAIRFYCANGSSGVPVVNARTEDNAIDDINWHHIAVTGDGAGDTLKIYIDGIEQNLTYDTNYSSLATGNATNNVTLGRANHSSMIYELDGKLFDSRLYDTALSEAEIDYLYTFGSDGTDPGTTNLVGQYKSDDTHPTIAYDSSGNGGHGTKTNITAASFHYNNDDVPYSFQNAVGFSKSIIKHHSSNNWNAGFNASNTIALINDAEIRMGVYNIDSNTEVQMIGFDTSNPNHNRTSMDYAIYHNTNAGANDYRVFENGSNKLTFSVTPAVGDTIAVRKEGTKINYLVNGVSYYTSTVDVSGDLVIDNSIFRPESVMRGLKFFKDGTEIPIDITSMTYTSNSYIPRDEANTSKDVLGNDLEFSGSTN